MKKSLSVILCFVILFLCGCKENRAINHSEKDKETGYINGVWISYIEVDNMIKSGDFGESFKTAVNNLKSLHITDIFFHCVPFCDAYYKSGIYPLRKSDILSDAVKIAHENGMRLHAWINPYRVKTSDNDVTSLPECDFFKNLDEDTLLVTENGVYLNPASVEVRQRVINGCRELCTDYKVDGIHFDDYFYPTVSEDFDKKTYEEYLSENENPLSLFEYRTANVNALISGCYTAVKFINKDIIFSVSPAADIEKNKSSYFADVAAWCSSGCVDMIIPQLYFGFHYPNERFCFNNLLNEWKEVISPCNVKLVIGLAAYKIGTTSLPDSEEWGNGEDIIPRETEICLNDNKISGQVFYSYSSLFSENPLNKNSRLLLSSVLDIKS